MLVEWKQERLDLIETKMGGSSLYKAKEAKEAPIAPSKRKATAGEEGQSSLGRSLQRRASRELKRRAFGASAAEDSEAEGAHEPADVVECAAPAQPSTVDGAVVVVVGAAVSSGSATLAAPAAKKG
jgi:hypothetical protein